MCVVLVHSSTSYMPVRRIPVVELCRRLEGDRVAEGLELLDEVGLVPVGVAAAGEPVAAEVVVVAVAFEQVPGDHQDRVAHRDRGLLLADPAGQPPELGGQVGVAAAGRGPATTPGARRWGTPPCPRRSRR